MESKEFREFTLGVYILGIRVNMSKKGFAANLQHPSVTGLRLLNSSRPRYNQRSETKWFGRYKCGSVIF